MIRPSKRMMRIVTIVYVLVLIALSVLPSGGALGGWDQDITPTLQNLLHVPAYALLVVLVAMTTSHAQKLGYSRILLIAVLCTVFATILELAQAFIPGRSASVADVLLNIAGTLVGSVVVAFSMRDSVSSAAGRVCVEKQ